MRDWEVPKSRESLYSFVGMVLFYSKYAPYLEMRIKPLTQLLKAYFRKPIPPMTSSASLLLLFQDVKDQIVASLIMARYVHSKLALLKTDWSTEGMGWISMQPANDKMSMAAEDEFKSGGKCMCDISKSGARLLHIAFG